MEQELQEIFDVAKDRGLKKVEVRVKDTGNMPVELWVNGKDRFCSINLRQLKKAVQEHKSLTWMN